jgi:hypothetical protein
VGHVFASGLYGIKTKADEKLTVDMQFGHYQQEYREKIKS